MVSIAIFSLPPLDKSKIKSTLGLSNKRVWYFLSVDYIHSKRPMTLLQAFELVSKDIDHAVLIIVGTGMLEKEMVQFCMKKKIPVIFMGNLYGIDLLSVYQSADIFRLYLTRRFTCKCTC